MRYIFLTLILTISTILSGQTNEVNSKLERAKIYVNAAEVHRTAVVNLKKGNNEVFIKELSSQINANSIVLSAGSGFEVNSTGFITKNNDIDEEKIPGYRALQDSLIYFERQYTIINNKLRVYKEEISLLQNNTKLSGNNGVNVIELERMSLFYNKRLNEIYNESSNLEYTKKIFTNRERIVKNNINELLKKYPIAPNGKILVQITAENAGQCKLTFSYVTKGASWYPIYEARVEDIKKPIILVQKASVRQFTGENWENVILEISTGNPNQGLSLPILYPRYADFSSPERTDYGNGSGAGEDYYDIPTESLSKSNRWGENRKEDKKNPAFKSYSSEVAIDYQIDLPYNLPSSNTPILVLLNNYELAATYSYFSIPRIDCSVYLTAMITNWQQYNLIPGQVNLFYNKSYVGNTFLSPQADNDTLKLSLGKDAKIIIKRINERDYTKTKYFGSTKKEILGYSIQINNTNNTDIDLIIEDQIPLSKNNEIIIENTELSKGIFDVNTGKLTWNIKIKSNKTDKILVSYEVTSPKNKPVFGL